jgi:receptor expression-enhancing protein 5/6
MATSSSKSSSSGSANKLQSIQKALHDFLHTPSAATPIFELVEKNAKIKREYLFLGLVTFLALYLVIGYGAGLVVNLLGFVYPAFKSCQAIDSEDKDDDTQWLTYWVVYAAFGIIEYFTDIFLGWVPFYFLAKVSDLILLLM